MGWDATGRGGQVLEMMRSVGTVMLIVPRGVNRVLMAYWMGLNRWQIPDMEATATRRDSQRGVGAVVDGYGLPSALGITNCPFSGRGSSPAVEAPCKHPKHC